MGPLPLTPATRDGAGRGGRAPGHGPPTRVPSLRTGECPVKGPDCRRSAAGEPLPGRPAHRVGGVDLVPGGLELGHDGDRSGAHARSRRGRHRAPVWRRVPAVAHGCHRTHEGPGRSPGARRVAEGRATRRSPPARARPWRGVPCAGSGPRARRSAPGVATRDLGLPRDRGLAERPGVLGPVGPAHPAEPVLRAGLDGEVVDRRLVRLDAERGAADAAAHPAGGGLGGGVLLGGHRGAPWSPASSAPGGVSGGPGVRPVSAQWAVR